MSVIQNGCHVLFINSKTGDLKCVRLPRNQPIYIKPLSFEADCLIGQRYGQKYEVVKHQLKKIETPVLSVEEPLENCGKNNEFIKDDGSTQILSQNDIESMKADGIRGEEIVKNLVENSTTFNEKTQFSKAKWLKKKINKYQPNVITKKPSLRLFCSAPTSKLRPDIYAKIINNANVWAGSKSIVVECKDDLLTSAISQRIGSTGSVVQVFEQKLPHTMYCKWLDYSKEQLDAIRYYPLKFLSKLNPDSNNEVNEIESQEVSEERLPELGKRKRDHKVIPFSTYEHVFDHLKSAVFDSLIISAHYDPFPVLQLLWSCLRPSASVVLHTEYLSVVLECANFVNSKGCAELSVVDQWFREIQVLPGRTHPNMRMQTGGGFVLTCTKVAEGMYGHGTNDPIVDTAQDQNTKKLDENTEKLDENTEKLDNKDTVPVEPME